MRRLAATLLLASTSIILIAGSASASDIVWEVQNPFRFFKKPAAFALHERAFDAVRGKEGTPMPANIVWRTERRLNDPDCTDKSSPARCAATARKGFETSRLGWASPGREVLIVREHLEPAGAEPERARERIAENCDVPDPAHDRQIEGGRTHAHPA